LIVAYLLMTGVQVEPLEAETERPLAR